MAAGGGHGAEESRGQAGPGSSRRGPSRTGRLSYMAVQQEKDMALAAAAKGLALLVPLVGF